MPDMILSQFYPSPALVTNLFEIQLDVTLPISFPVILFVFQTVFLSKILRIYHVSEFQNVSSAS
jgi:hypothetical protein